MSPHHPDDPPLGGDWHLDAVPDESIPDSEILVPDDSPPEELPPSSTFIAPPPSETPPSPEQLIEAMIFVGGHPLSAVAACSAIRGLSPEAFHEAIENLAYRYRQQARPYTILPREGGFVLTLLPSYRALREKLFGGPREARLGQPALDVLAIVAYRQSVTKAEIDGVRGLDSASILRQLVRLGLVAVQHRAEAGTKTVRYGTTPRFLQVFGLSSLEELPRLGETLPG